MKNELKNLIPKDKLLHNFWGKYLWILPFLLCLIFFSVSTSGLIAFGISLLIAIGIEIYDGLSKTGYAEVMDVVYSMEVPVYLTMLAFLI